MMMWRIICQIETAYKVLMTGSWFFVIVTSWSHTKETKPTIKKIKMTNSQQARRCALLVRMGRSLSMVAPVLRPVVLPVWSSFMILPLCLSILIVRALLAPPVLSVLLCVLRWEFILIYWFLLYNLDLSRARAALKVKRFNFFSDSRPIYIERKRKKKTKWIEYMHDIEYLLRAKQIEWWDLLN